MREVAGLSYDEIADACDLQKGAPDLQVRGTDAVAQRRRGTFARRAFSIRLRTQQVR
jgi:hypothetical protein